MTDIVAATSRGFTSGANRLPTLLSLTDEAVRPPFDLCYGGSHFKQSEIGRMRLGGTDYEYLERCPGTGDALRDAIAGTCEA